MTTIFHAFLYLYPASVRETFGPEMQAVFAEGLAEASERGFSASTRFVTVELAAVVVNAMRAWLDLRKPGLAAAASAAPMRWTPREIRDAQERIARNIERMTFAIAHHEFVEARRYAIEEQKARRELQELRDRLGFDDDSDPGSLVPKS
jgi:hypothetical protein